MARISAGGPVDVRLTELRAGDQVLAGGRAGLWERAEAVGSGRPYVLRVAVS
ncbi:hypothetical protein ACFCXT_10610 [Streptomyces vinaceus]|uniref:hypothetical protein n=1 Tax=Streptomyces vinaceus TaxID=1960 RepID=UPI0035E0D9E0